MYSPQICHRMLEQSSWLNHDAALQPPLRALATIAVAREKDCVYLWSVHVPRARQEGTSEQIIATVSDRSEDLRALPAAERDVVLFIRQREHRVEQGLFERLRDERGVPWLVDLTCYVGNYGVLAAILSNFEIPPAAGAETF
jgi:alkylhydroperoxidase family enzyme